jgi:hypothetical protein
MTKNLLTKVFALLGAVGLAMQPASDAQAVTRALDNAPAATLLLPYFESDLKIWAFRPRPSTSTWSVTTT